MRDYEPYYTQDGSIGLYSYRDKDVYHSKFGALTEAWEKFVIPSKLDDIINRQDKINVLDICYGIGYNTKALMSYVFNTNKNYLTKKNLFQKIHNFVSVYTNNIFINKKDLSSYNETVCNDNIISKFSVDCLDIEEELIKLSPYFKTIKTPGEIYAQIVPSIFDCFEMYYKIEKIFIAFLTFFYPKNKKQISELLDLKFKNLYRDKEYKINPIVNYILINRLHDFYGKEFLDKSIKKILRNRHLTRYFDKKIIKYAKFNRFWGYSLSSKHNLSAFLHNIYYRHLSNRNKKINFKLAESLFDIHFYPDDARKTILNIQKKYDCIFLDAFTYTKAPQLWTVDFIAQLAEHLKPNGVILTYSTSAQIRNTMLENNLYVGKIYNSKNNKFIGTIASKDKQKIEYPLTNYEIGLCNTKAGIPYEDPNLNLDKKDILELREYVYRHSELMSASKYMKLRSMRGEDEQI